MPHGTRARHILSTWTHPTVPNVETLEAFYAFMTAWQPHTSVSAKVALLSALLIVGRGNHVPGHALLQAILGALFLVSAFIAVGYGGQVFLLVLVSAAGMAAVAAGALQRVPWRVVPAAGPLRWPLILLYTLVIFWPFWPFQTWGRTFAYSLVGVLPHQALLTGLLLAFATGSEARLPGYIFAGAGLILGLADAALAGQGSSLLLVLLGGAVLARCTGKFGGAEFARLLDQEPESKDEALRRGPVTTEIRASKAPSAARRSPTPEEPGPEQPAAQQAAPKNKRPGNGKKWDLR